jgi:hypothetical protein
MSVARSVRARTCPDIELKIASTRAEREAAFELTYGAYVRAGLCESHVSGLRATRFQLLSSTDILIAQQGDEVISTLSLVRDGSLGLPMEQVYAEEVATRRDVGLRLAEVSCLADRRQSTARNFGLYCDLCSLMVQLAQKLDIDQLLAVVHPRHAPLYRRYMGFQQIGDYHDYPAVRGNPGVALSLDLQMSPELRPACWDKFFGVRLPEEVIRPQPINPADDTYFQAALGCDSQSNRLGSKQRLPVVKSVADPRQAAEVVMPESVDGCPLMCV